MMAVHPPNPKYIPKPYEQMDYPGQRIQVDVKFVPSVCLKNSKVVGKKFFQYTAIDEYSRWRFVEALKEVTERIMSVFMQHMNNLIFMSFLSRDWKPQIRFKGNCCHIFL